jgi:hypothetical protein
MIEAQLPSNWQDLAREQGIDPSNVPVQLGSKVKDLSIPLRLILFHVGTNTSLRTTAAMAAASGLIDMSAVALHKWMRKMGAFLAPLLAGLVGGAKRFAAELWAGYEILIVDATSVARPGSAGTTARVHYALRLTDLQPVLIDVTDDKGGETFRRFAAIARRGQLWIGDRGYTNPPGIAAITATGADVLVRHNRWSLPLYDVDGEPLDVRRKLERLTKPCRPREWAAWVQPQGAARIRGRLCAVRLPPDKAEEARARLRREHDGDVSAEMFEIAAFVILFTTVVKERLSLDRILELYTLRWQVELKIKRDKSIAGLDQLPNYRDDTIRSWILAKMLLTEIALKVSTPEVHIPPCVA